jgi:PDZ domain-containing protein
VIVSLDESVSAPPAMVTTEEHLVARPRRRRRSLLVAIGVLVVLIVATSLIRLPYFTLGPGAVRPTGSLISVDGGQVFPPEGGMAYTTVSVNGRINAWQALVGWLDPEVDIVNEDLILQGRSPKESQQVNLQEMADSKDTATNVALQHLGLATPAGAEVVQVVEGSPAQQVLQAGDVITSVDGQPVVDSGDLVGAITSHKPGDVVELTLTRAPAPGDGPRETITASATLGTNENQPEEAFFGVRVQTWFDSTFPYPVTIDSGQVGGPSAGLAFTLGLIDELTPGELTGGQEVAATGTMSPDGTVGPIGGLEHKVDAVRHAGVKLFLVPDSQTPEEMARAQSRTKGEVQIVPVHDLDAALAALAAHGGQPPGPVSLQAA